MNEKRRQKLAGALLGIARTGRRDKVAAVADDLLTTEGWRDRYSAKYLVEQALPELVAKLAERPEIAHARDLVQTLVAEYEGYSTVQVVRLPVVNLGVRSRLEVGGAVLRRLDEDLLAEMEASLRLVILEPPNPPGTADLACDRLREGFSERMGQVVAELRVNAMQDVAQVQARERYAELLDFLNGAATILYPRNQRVRVGAAGQLAREIENSYMISDPPDTFTNTTTWTGPLGELDLDGRAVSRLKEVNYWQISDVLARAPKKRTELESALVTALHWYADHTVHTTPASQLLSLTISAETLFPRRGSGIGFTCAEATAFALSDNPQRRFLIRRTFQDLYRKRGDIAHRGKGDVTEDDVHVLANLVMELLLKVVSVRSDFATRADLEDWIDELRLA